MEPLIQLTDLARSYGDRPAVRGISLAIPGGEVFGLLGPNGAGKSTTIKMLATLLRPSGGTARIAGHDLATEANEVRRIIGYVPEGADLYDVLSGREFLDLTRDLHRVPEGEAAEALCNRPGIGPAEKGGAPRAAGRETPRGGRSPRARRGTGMASPGACHGR